VANPFVHVELNTPNPERAKAFYSKLFQCNWKTCQTLPFPMYLYRDQGWRRHGVNLEADSGGPSDARLR